MSLEINGEIIEDDIIQNELDYLIKNLSHQPIESEKELLLQNVKENLIYKTLLRQEANKLTVDISPEHIEREYQIFFQSSHILALSQSPEKIQEAKEYIQNKLKENVLIEKVCSDMLPPTDVHLETFYRENKDHYYVAKQFHYAHFNFSYSLPDQHSSLHDLLTTVTRSLIDKFKGVFNPSSFNKISALVMDIAADFIKEKNIQYQNLTRTIAIEKLNKDGLSFFENLAQQNPISKVTDLKEINLLFTPVKDSNLPTLNTSAISINKSKEKNFRHLGFYILLNTRSNFIPVFEEIKEQVKKDLLNEMEQIKLKSYLRRIMKKSSIKDISYI